MNWEGARIGDVEPRLWKRKAFEATQIKVQPHTNIWIVV